MSVITYGFPLVSVKPRLGHQCFRTGGLFCFSGINYTTESISGNGSVGIPGGHHATPIEKRYISAPGIGNEYIMLSERSWCGVSTPLRSGKDSPTNGINNFFLQSGPLSGIISGTISRVMLIYRAFAPGLPGVGTAFYTA